MEITISLAVFKALSKFINPKNSRLQLVGIYMDSKGFAVATDGHIIGVAKIPTPCPEVILPWTFVSEIIKTKTTKPTVTIDVGADIVTCVIGQIAIRGVINPDLVYVTWRRVYPATVSGEHAYYDVRLLQRIADAGEALGASKATAGMLPLRMNGQGVAMVALRDDFHAGIMPLRPVAVNPDFTPFAI